MNEGSVLGEGARADGAKEAGATEGVCTGGWVAVGNAAASMFQSDEGRTTCFDEFWLGITGVVLGAASHASPERRALGGEEENDVLVGANVGALSRLGASEM